MKSINKAIILLLFSLAANPVNAQFNELALLESMTSEISGSSSDSIDNDDSEFEAEDEVSQEGKNVSFIDENYGYTGGGDFNNAPQENLLNKAIAYFGYDFFINNPSTYATKNIPIPPDYVVGPNDNVKVILFGNNNKTYNLKVSRDGEIFFPDIGPIAVSGLSFSDLKDTIETYVLNRLIGTQVKITLGNLRSIDIFVLGEAIEPGMYTVSALSTLTNAIFKSGGVRVTGSLRDIQLKRQGELVSTFDFYDLLLNGDTSDDIRLMQGDVVFIPPITKTVGITGEIGRPGIYELRKDESLNDLIRYSGMLKPKATLPTSTIQRVDSSINGFNLIPINNIQNLAGVALQYGDVVTINSVADNLSNAILIKGHAQQPGFFALKNNMRILDVMKSSESLLSLTDLNYLLIKRINPINQKINFIQVDLEELFLSKNLEKNLLLQQKDELILFPSLLNADLITTRLIQDKYILNEEENQMVLKDEWTGPTYLRKSLMEEQINIEGARLINPETSQMESIPSNTTTEDIKRYYEYSIYNYCTIPEPIIIKILDQTGYKANKSIALKELSEITSPNDIIELQRQIEKERIENLQQSSSEEISGLITDICRNQLLAPVLEIVDRQIQRNNQKKVITIYGNVHFPGTYPMTNNMVLADAIKAGGGLKQATFDSEIELSRSNKEGKKYTVTNSFVSLANEKAMNTTLQEGDIINFKEISTQIKIAEITGEVYFEGKYPISENQTLKELLERAGGITDYGSLKAAIFQRESIKNLESERMKTAKSELRKKILLSSQAGGIGQTSLDSDGLESITQLLTSDKNEVEALGRLVVDIDSIMNGKIDDIILEDGDTIHIPKINQSISVIGEVFMANSHLYKDNLTMDEYIQLSGGLNDFGDSEKTYIIKADGRVISPSQLSSSGFFRSNSSNLQPGDTIVVPLQVQPFSGIKATTEVTQIIYQMALAAAAVNSF